ncbi:MAG: SRPBCC family protein [Gammaproteobacteria bacterium]|nr:SRPBCC family protein [Gammaproteobacteria bacterium]MDD9895927.1 SRPBCC family protein [Gammaproteobacteria bacterium]MDD9959822.1 SRPBCC family protein [Gammaproteobacteria bacterium]
MKTLFLEEQFSYSAEDVWAVIGDLERHDWLPSVMASRHEDGIRYYLVEKLGEVQQRILKLDSESYYLEYMVIHGPSELEQHLSIIEVQPNDCGCVVAWTSEFLPASLEDKLEKEKSSALQCLRSILAIN